MKCKGNIATIYSGNNLLHARDSIHEGKQYQRNLQSTQYMLKTTQPHEYRYLRGQEMSVADLNTLLNIVPPQLGYVDAMHALLSELLSKNYEAGYLFHLVSSMHKTIVTGKAYSMFSLTFL